MTVDKDTKATNNTINIVEIEQELMEKCLLYALFFKIFFSLQ